MKAVLHLTGACNLRCRYCYVGEKTAGRMTSETARTAIEMTAAQSRDAFTISFMGGEPLLAYPLLQEAVGHAERIAAERNQRVSFRMTTNGLLFDPDRLRWCRDHRVLFALSIDGDAESHDANRITARGVGSHAQLMAGLDAILRGSLVVIAIAVVTPRTAHRVDVAMRYLLDRGVDKIILSPDFGGEWDRKTLRALRDAYRRLADDYVARHRAGQEVYLSVFDEKIATHALGPVRRGTPWDMGEKSFSVVASGEIHPCVRFVRPETDLRFRIGTVAGGLDEPRRREIIALNRRPRSKCEGSELDGRCANR